MVSNWMNHLHSATRSDRLGAIMRSPRTLLERLKLAFYCQLPYTIDCVSASRKDTIDWTRRLGSGDQRLITDKTVSHMNKITVIGTFYLHPASKIEENPRVSGPNTFSFSAGISA
ncbi:hypothetical protein N7G274_007137 [Stereocaulon virgatum]|uniref:Uncharacterized protein n=1 Tax=Stereocaulon virgatum TaxID=373712 RepID=A0ABR4A642_9LECA